MKNQNEIIPPGTMVLWAGGAKQYGVGTIPAPGWLWCDGSILPAGLYPALRTVLTDKFGNGIYTIAGDPVTTVRLPGQASYASKGFSGPALGNFVNNTHNHATPNTLANPSVNYNAVQYVSHGHNYVKSTSSGGSDHSHGNNVGCSNNTAGNVNRASGTANLHLQGHAHNSGASSNAAGAGHNHNFGGNITNNTIINAHSHNSPSLSVGNYDTLSFPTNPTQSTIALWHIIKT